MSNNIIVATLKYIAVEILWDIVYFPVWWYSTGLVRVVKFCLNSAAQHLNRRLALGIWLPFSPLASAIKLQPLPVSYFIYLPLVLLAYCLLTQMVKSVYIRKFKSWL